MDVFLKDEFFLNIWNNYDSDGRLFFVMRPSKSVIDEDADATVKLRMLPKDSGKQRCTKLLTALMLQAYRNASYCSPVKGTFK